MNSGPGNINKHIIILGILLLTSVALWEHDAVASYFSSISDRLSSNDLFESGHAHVSISEESNARAEKARNEHKRRFGKLASDPHYTIAKNRCWAACMKKQNVICHEESGSMMDCIERGIKIQREERRKRGHTVPK